ncbi:DNA topoisomerase (ATP-hydrolyzing) subunit A [Spirochaeta thermophila]|uniref:DNA gyrase subunit A n=1 Tax=Winmispira thermophila (strain ATCC 49972 / DSM 6192 / RI 19.B1) TaxID=665571 RepID=E0RRS3_WINT6|nr:DNA topoisomerase (ATP-hydrolyzing) subunit A [Spirochaeta thermophila]ADN03177.1 DNA gyrase subunit A [Spirochaeta thermophila DSM 6192]
MADLKGKVVPVPIEEEIKESYLNYAMSVIVSRALPDVRDGLKPVQRRILYAMYEMGLRHDRPFKKSGRIVGDVLGKYHPHGDQSIYDALVRLAQEFSMRYPMVIGQGNFGSIDGDPPAAMRYTEAKLHKIAEEMLRDINKETVDFVPNYDESLKEPAVLPAAVPYLLINGASGIAVGMATNIPPHNLGEVSRAIAAVIDNPEIPPKDLLRYVKGPDFPTGGIIFGKKGIRSAYLTGKGGVVVRARLSLETLRSGREAIVVTEIPYAVNKSSLLERVASLVRDKKIEGISEIRDESDRNGLRIVFELKRGVIPKVVINRLFSMTPLQTTFHVNALALVGGKPQTLTLKEIIQHFISHRKEVVTRRAQYDLRKAEERAHILEGLKIALDNIDEVIAIIKKSRTVDSARNNLMRRFGLSERQAQAILDMRLQKLTSLETRKIIEELEATLKLIEELKELLGSERKILEVVKNETLELAKEYGDERRTEIVAEEAEDLDIEDLIQKEDMVVLVSRDGLIKRMPVSAYRRQGRGGKGLMGGKLSGDDVVSHLFVASTHDYILFLSNEGKAYYLKVHEIPEGSRVSQGKSIRSLVQLSPDEQVSAVVSVETFEEEREVFMITAKGLAKRLPVPALSNARTRGVIAIGLEKGDYLVDAFLTEGKGEVMIVTRRGHGLRCKEEEFRSMGRAARGVTAVKLEPGDEVCGAVPVEEGKDLLLVTSGGYGKRVEFSQFTAHGRGTKGQIAYKVSARTGELAAVLSVEAKDDVMIVTAQGNIIKLAVKDISVLGRQAAGVKVVNLEKPDYVVSVDRVAREK